MINLSSSRLTFFLGVYIAAQKINAFVITKENLISSVSQRPITELYGRKKGKLSQNVKPGGVSTKRRSKAQQKKSSASTAGVSSSLSDWASSQTTSSTTAEATNSQPKLKSDSVDFKPFDKNSKGKKEKGSSARRERQSERQALDRLQSVERESKVSAIKTILEDTNINVKDVIQLISDLCKVEPATSFKSLLNGDLKDYSLAWTGSDEAICHVGTGLHNVPLARLQDVFLSIGRDDLSGKSKTFALLEVIRILGPFPNVRNTLQGSVTDFKTVSNGDIKAKIKYDSMVDGLGKEIAAGTEDNSRQFSLNILYADEYALVLTTEDGNGENGENILLFLKEEDLDSTLNGLRAS